MTTLRRILSLEDPQKEPITDDSKGAPKINKKRSLTAKN